MQSVICDAAGQQISDLLPQLFAGADKQYLQALPWN
jgi:hypothetical protein